MSDKPLGVGLVGCGDIAPAHAQALATAKSAALVACMDVVESSAKSLGEQYQVPWTTKLEDLLARSEVELVTIATPAFTHLPLTQAAAKAGKPVLCEKPLASTLADGQAMIAACKHAGVALSTCFPLRYLGAAKWAKELIAAGALGEIIEVRMRNLDEKKESYWTGGYSGRTITDWRKSKQASGGGVVITNLIHHLDLARAITGLEVVRAYAEMGTFATPVEVEDVAVASLRYENKAIAVVEGLSCYVGRSDEHPMVFLGAKGQLRFMLWGGKAQVYLTEPAAGLPAKEWVSREFQDAALAGFYDALAPALQAGRTPPLTGEDGLKALEIVMAIYQAGETGQAVVLGR
jgi:predicted dehydrogenase